MYSIFLLAAVVATTYTFGKCALTASPPIFLIGSRLTIAGSVFMAWYGIRYKTFPRLTWRDWLLLAQVAFFGFYAGFILEFWALQHMNSAKTALIYSVSPFIAALLSYYAFNEAMTRKKFIGLFIGLLGFVPTILMNGDDCCHLFTGSFISWPELAVMAAVFSFVYGWIVMRKLLTFSKINESFVMAFGMLTGGIAALITSMLTEVSLHHSADWIAPMIPVTDAKTFVLCGGALIIFGNLIAYKLYAYTLRFYTATLMSFGELITPLFAAFYGWLFLGESVSIYFFASMALFLIGMYIFYQEEKRLGYFMEQ